MSDPVSAPVHHPLSAATRQSFQERIADHVAAIVAAARELQATVAPDRDLASYQEGAEVPVLMNLQVGLPHHGATVLHIPHPGKTCPSGTSPFFFTYVAGHFATGEAYYAMDVFCA